VKIIVFLFVFIVCIYNSICKIKVSAFISSKHSSTTIQKEQLWHPPPFTSISLPPL